MNKELDKKIDLALSKKKKIIKNNGFVSSQLSISSPNPVPIINPATSSVATLDNVLKKLLSTDFLSIDTFFFERAKSIFLSNSLFIINLTGLFYFDRFF